MQCQRPGGGGGLYGGILRQGKVHGGVLPPFAIPKSQLPQSHVQAHAPFRARNICKLSCNREHHQFTTSERICCSKHLPQNPKTWKQLQTVCEADSAPVCEADSAQCCWHLHCSADTPKFGKILPPS